MTWRVGYEALLDRVYHYGKDDLWRKGDMIRRAMEDLAGSTGPLPDPVAETVGERATAASSGLQPAPVAVMVGDRASDLEAARSAGIPFVGCLYGYGSLEEIRGADRLVETVEDLAQALLGPAVPPQVRPGS